MRNAFLGNNVSDFSGFCLYSLAALSQPEARDSCELHIVPCTVPIQQLQSKTAVQKLASSNKQAWYQLICEKQIKKCTCLIEPG
jgi:hypothetical protein